MEQPPIRRNVETVSLETAKNVVDKTRSARSAKLGCADCKTMRFEFPKTEAEWPPLFIKPDDLSAPYAVRLTEEAEKAGWEEMSGCWGYVIKCEPCKTRQTFPWADKLDVERVRAFMQKRIDDHPQGKNLAFWLGELEALV